jgi:hypothetical protein
VNRPGNAPASVGLHLLHERREPRARQPVIERFAGHRDGILVVEGAQQIGQRLDSGAAERRDHRQEQPVRGDRPQPGRLARVAAQVDSPSRWTAPAPGCH